VSRDLTGHLCAHGLSLSDYEALLHLDQAEGGRMRRVDLAERLGLSPSGVTRLLEGLEQCGLVERHVCRSDLRVAYAVITAAGRGRLAVASTALEAAVHTRFDERFDEHDRAQLADLLERLSR